MRTRVNWRVAGILPHLEMQQFPVWRLFTFFVGRLRCHGDLYVEISIYDLQAAERHPVSRSLAFFKLCFARAARRPSCRHLFPFIRWSSSGLDARGYRAWMVRYLLSALVQNAVLTLFRLSQAEEMSLPIDRCSGKPEATRYTFCFR